MLELLQEIIPSSRKTSPDPEAPRRIRVMPAPGAVWRFLLEVDGKSEPARDKAAEEQAL